MVGAEAAREEMALTTFCGQLGLKGAFLQTVPENAAVDAVTAVCEKLTHLVPRKSPTNSEGFHQERWNDTTGRSKEMPER